MGKILELKVDQCLENTTENAHSRTYILLPVNVDAISASKIKLQITETDMNPCDLGDLEIGDVYTFEVKKSNKQKKLDEDKPDDD